MISNKLSFFFSLKPSENDISNLLTVSEPGLCITEEGGRGLQVLVNCQYPSQSFYFLGKINSFIRVGKSGQNKIVTRPRSTNRV